MVTEVQVGSRLVVSLRGEMFPPLSESLYTTDRVLWCFHLCLVLNFDPEGEGFDHDGVRYPNIT